MSSSKEPSGNILLNLHPLHRLLISIAGSLVVFFTMRETDWSPLFVFIVIWDVFALIYLITCWIVFFRQSAVQIKGMARKEDGSRLFVFLLVVTASFASMFSVLLLILSEKEASSGEGLYLVAVVAGMLLSWMMVHTIFGFHYAHIYYGESGKDEQSLAGGLDFPGNEKPDYLDFAYFSFVIGMTFQVSDVSISSRAIRRLALAHGLLSFGLNTFVVALTINLIAGLQK